MPGEEIKAELQTSKWIIDMPPINSSGDVYHVLAYLMSVEAKKSKEKFSVWVLTDETGTSKKQVERITNFAEVLGFGGIFEAKSIGVQKAHYQQRREEGAVAFIKKESLILPDATFIHIHQRITSVILANFFKTNPKISKVINEGFNYIDDIALAKVSKERNAEQPKKMLEDFVNRSVLKIAASLIHGQPLVILHVRHVGSKKGTNEEQNLKDSDVPKWLAFLEKKGYCAWSIFADDRSNPFSGIEERRITPFAGKWAQLSAEDVDRPKRTNKIKEIFPGFYKLLHLKLLLKLHEEKEKLKLVGIIGNTSGTLDVAAFIGHQVYNIHKFATPLDYQDYRLLVQTLFMTVESRESLLLEHESKEESSLEEWLTSGKTNKPPAISYNPLASKLCPELSFYSEVRNGILKNQDLPDTAVVFTEVNAFFKPRPAGVKVELLKNEDQSSVKLLSSKPQLK